MAKYRSYNEELLIAQILLGNIFNDIVIDRRKHGLNRQYSKPIHIQDIVQKNIQIPCIFGDIGTILRSLENETGTIQLPLFILQSGGVKSDMSRNCDIHVDIFYQQDDAFFDLEENDPLYKRFDQKLDKQRGLPITIEYTLTLITKYKEDLDQMMTNWMVHCRPDLYVKWWHPRNKTYPLESEILWGQSINYQAPSDIEPTTRFQYKATTDFTFKTWVFPGMTQQIDPSSQKLIEYFNYYSTIDGEKYPVLANKYKGQTAGFFVVDHNQEFENFGDDPEGILAGKYMVNNVESRADSIIYDPVSGILEPGQPRIEIEDLVKVGDIVGIEQHYEKYPKYATYSTLLEADPIQNEYFGFKYVYFKGGFPYESFIEDPISGDLLLKHFHSSINVETSNNKESLVQPLSTGFGFTYTDPLTPNFEYNINTKELTIWGQMNNYPHYVSTIKSIITSANGIKQEINLKAVSVNNKYPIEIGFKRGLNAQFKEDLSVKEDIFDHVAIWNNDKTKWFEQSSDFGVGLDIELNETQQQLAQIQYQFLSMWDELELQCVNENLGIFELKPENIDDLRTSSSKEDNEKINRYVEFIKNIKKITKQKNKALITGFNLKQTIHQDNAEYLVLINNYYYVVTKQINGQEDIEIYDHGVVSMPKFAYGSAPIFNVTYPEGNLVYGINVVSRINLK